MKRLGVLVLSDPSKGGTYQYTLSVLNGLRYLKGWDITLYTTKDNSSYSESKFPVRYIDRRLDQRLVSLAIEIFGGAKQDPFGLEDAVLAPIYSPVLLHTETPFAYTLHDLQELYFPENFSFLQRQWRHYIHSRLTKKCGKVICESRFVQDDIIRTFNVSKENVEIIVAPPLAEEGERKGGISSSTIFEKYGISKSYIFYPAQFWLHKNHLRLIEAFSRIVKEYPESTLVLTGKKRDEYNRVFQKVEELGLTRYVKHIGYVDQEDISRLYEHAVALVMPSLFESVSIPVFEAFQQGTPVAVSNIVALPEQVGDAGLLFDPLSIDELESTIRKLLSDRELCSTLSSLGRERLSSLTFEKNGDETGRMLSRLIERDVRENNKVSRVTCHR